MTTPLFTIASASCASRGIRAAHCGHFAILPSIQLQLRQGLRTTPLLRRCVVVNEEANRRQQPSVTVRLSVDEKRRFAAIAAARGVSESKLALVAIRILLASTHSRMAIEDPVTPGRECARDRITIRLRPGDRRAIRDRAASRGLKDSAYIAALVRCHISASPPLTGSELAALKASVAVLAGLGRLLARISREGPSTESVLIEELRRIRACTAGLESQTHDLIRAALQSWESQYG